MLNIILPSLPYQRDIDPMWQEEMDVARTQSYSVCLYDAEQQKLYQQPDAQRPTLYRGWMLTGVEYQQLADKTPLLVSPEMYLASHRADGWYSLISDFTPPSIIIEARAAKAAAAAFLQRNGRAFVKGLSKSFDVESVISSLPDLVTLLHKHRIEPQDSLFVRAFVELSTQPEQRFFAVREEAFGANDAPFPESLQPALKALASWWFYTIDVAYTQTGEPIIIGVGNGQVSNTKEWLATDLYSKVISRLAELTTRP